MCPGGRGLSFESKILCLHGGDKDGHRRDFRKCPAQPTDQRWLEPLVLPVVP